MRSPALISASSKAGCHAVLASLSGRYPPLEGRSPTCYSPVRHSTQGRSPFRVRLACVRHAASVDSEPGSNSHVKFAVLHFRSRSRASADRNCLTRAPVDWLLRCFVLVWWPDVALASYVAAADTRRAVRFRRHSTPCGASSRRQRDCVCFYTLYLVFKEPDARDCSALRAASQSRVPSDCRYRLF